MARRRRGQFPQPKQENGQWKIRYYTDQAQPDGTRRRVRKTKCLGRVTEMTLTEARKEAQRFIQPINDVEPQTEHSEKTVTTLIERWRSDLKPNLKRSTQDSYEWAFKRISHAFGENVVGDLTRMDVQSFLTKAARTLAAESVRDLRARLRGLLTLAEDWDWIAKGSNPAAGRLRMPPRSHVRLRPIPTVGEFQRLVLALPQPYRAIVALAGLSGLRRGELAALRWDDFGESTVRVDEAVYRGVLGTPKSRSSNRRVAVPHVALKFVDEWRRQCRFTQPRDFAFSIRTNSPIDLNREMERRIKPISESLGLPRYSWHDFRHGYTTWGRQAGVEAEVMRDQVGHSSVAMTQDVYSHLDNRAGAAEKIARLVWPQQLVEVA